ncbi:hypothetical protein V6Z72_13310 [Cereibacter sphaeroides]|uniref:hypothetical protein n=1 Tax=Cereibacter sphaeroides TaxID=1063 RepID=UPI003990DD81
MGWRRIWDREKPHKVGAVDAARKDDEWQWIWGTFWGNIENWWREDAAAHPNDRAPRRELLEALHQLVRKVSVQNGAEWAELHPDPSNVPVHLKGAAQILLLDELRATVEDEMTPDDEWDEIRAEVEEKMLKLIRRTHKEKKKFWGMVLWMQREKGWSDDRAVKLYRTRFGEAPVGLSSEHVEPDRAFVRYERDPRTLEASEPHPELSQWAHASATLAAFKQIDVAAGWAQSEADEDEHAWLRQIIAHVVRPAFAAGYRARSALGKEDECLAVARLAQLRGFASHGGPADLNERKKADAAERTDVVRAIALRLTSGTMPFPRDKAFIGNIQEELARFKPPIKISDSTVRRYLKND